MMMGDLASLPPTLTVEEAAKIIGIGRRQAYEHARQGILCGVSVIRLGRRVLVPTAPLLRALGL